MQEIEKIKKEFDDAFGDIRIAGIPYSDKIADWWTQKLIQIHDSAIEKCLEVVENELKIEKKVQEKAKEVFVVGKRKVAEMLKDKHTRDGKIESLSETTSSLTSLKIER